MSRLRLRSLLAPNRHSLGRRQQLARCRCTDLSHHVRKSQLHKRHYSPAYRSSESSFVAIAAAVAAVVVVVVTRKGAKCTAWPDCQIECLFKSPIFPFRKSRQAGSIKLPRAGTDKSTALSLAVGVTVVASDWWWAMAMDPVSRCVSFSRARNRRKGSTSTASLQM